MIYDYLIRMHKWITSWFEKPRWKELEKEFIQGRAQREYICFEDDKYYCKVYYLTNPLSEFPEPNGDTYVCIHGNAGTSLTFLNLIPHFPKGSRFYLIDLPGFGKSHTTCESPDTDYYVECIRRCMNTLGISQARFIAHSFGAFLTVHFANAYPERVENMTLIAPVGLFPTLGYNISRFAVLFRIFRFPYIIKYFRLLLWGLYRLNVFHKKTAYRLSCYGDRKTITGSHFASFMTFEWKNFNICGYWKVPILHKLLFFPKTIHLIYGEQDSIAPSHQGFVIQGIRQDITLDIIPKEWHCFIEQCSELIVNRTKQLNLVNFTAKQRERFNRIQDLVSKPEHYPSYFGFHATWLTIQQLYIDLLTV